MGEYKHGHSPRSGASPEYRVWTSMVQRCTNPARKHYDRYGGRGIRVCERWLGEGGFERFLADVGPRPSGETLDRFPNRDGNYEPGNVRWATPTEQNRNRSSNRLLEYAGATLTVTELAERAGINVHTVMNRMDRFGWSVERALTTPARHAPVAFRGRSQSARAWAREFGINPKTVMERLRRGWPIERALTERPPEYLASRPQCRREAT